jgi:PadR family transcriptional regulator PadR
MSPTLDTRTALLQALVEGESYGLALIERVEKRTNRKLRIQQGRVYPVLRQLEAEGLLESYDGDPMPERGGRPRRYYKLTAEGMRAARADAKAIAGLLKLALGWAR